MSDACVRDGRHIGEGTHARDEDLRGLDLEVLDALLDVGDPAVQLCPLLLSRAGQLTVLRSEHAGRTERM